MNTEQSNVGKGNYANPIEQTAITATQTANSMIKNQDYSFGRELHESAQERLLDYVNNYFEESGVSSQVELVNDLLHHWLTTSGVDPQDEANSERLKKAFALTNFLTTLYESNKNVQYFVDIQSER